MSSSFEVREVTSAQTLPLRTKVLRPGCEPDEALFAGPMPPDARHFAAFDGDEIVGVGFIVRVKAPFDDEPNAWMLRGMAVDPDKQGQGIGTAVVRYTVEEANLEGVKLFWFNARRQAVGFYRRLGFESIGEEFEIVGVGPHLRMFRWLQNP
ncbi:N-acetyltransferase [bacterium]|nr:MAG: N-acetyltransferase [bacterium]